MYVRTALFVDMSTASHRVFCALWLQRGNWWPWETAGAACGTARRRLAQCPWRSTTPRGLLLCCCTHGMFQTHGWTPVTAMAMVVPRMVPAMAMVVPPMVPVTPTAATGVTPRLAQVSIPHRTTVPTVPTVPPVQRLQS